MLWITKVYTRNTFELYVRSFAVSHVSLTRFSNFGFVSLGGWSQMLFQIASFGMLFTHSQPLSDGLWVGRGSVQFICMWTTHCEAKQFSETENIIVSREEGRRASLKWVSSVKFSHCFQWCYQFYQTKLTRQIKPGLLFFSLAEYVASIKILLFFSLVRELSNENPPFHRFRKRR